MLKCILVAALLLFNSMAFSQFHTIKRYRTLPSVETDTVAQIKAAITPIQQPQEQVSGKAGLLFSMPLQRLYINSDYGIRKDPFTGIEQFHRGIDFKSNEGDAALSIMPGKVSKVGYSRSLGSYVEVNHGLYRSIYGHLSAILVSEGMQVPAGAVMGLTGTSGRSTGVHLHFAMEYKGKAVSPAPYLEMISKEMEKRERTPVDLSSLQ